MLLLLVQGYTDLIDMHSTSTNINISYDLEAQHLSEERCVSTFSLVVAANLAVCFLVPY